MAACELSDVAKALRAGATMSGKSPDDIQAILTDSSLKDKDKFSQIMSLLGGFAGDNIKFDAKKFDSIKSAVTEWTEQEVNQAIEADDPQAAAQAISKATVKSLSPAEQILKDANQLNKNSLAKAQQLAGKQDTIASLKGDRDPASLTPIERAALAIYDKPTATLKATASAAPKELEPATFQAMKDLLHAPPDIRTAMINHAAQGISGGTGAIYGFNQDPHDDIKARITKALLYGAVGASGGHVLAGGPAREIGQRALSVYVNGLLTSGTLAVKGANDATAVLTGPIVRGIDAMLSGRVKTVPAEVVRGYVGAGSGMWNGLKAFANEMDPHTIGGNFALEAADKVPDTVQALYGKAQAGDQDALQQLRGKLTSGNSMPSVGQYTGSLTTRLIKGITEFAREVLKAQENYANEAATSRGATKLPDVEERVNRALLMNKPEGLLGGAAYTLATVPTKMAGENAVLQGVGKAIVPFRLIPSNMLEQVIEYIPGLGLTGLINTSDKSLVLSKQLLGVAGLTGAALAFGGNVFGNGPSDSVARKNWLAEGYRPWSVKVGNQYVEMRQLPAVIQGPLRVLGAIDDHKTFNSNEPVPIEAAQQFGSSLGDHNFFPSWMDLVQKSTTQQGLALSDVLSVERVGAAEAGSVVPSTLAEAAKFGQNAQPNTTPKGADFATMAQNAIDARLPGPNNALPPRLGPGGQPVPATNGVSALLGSYAPLPQRNDPVAALFAKAGTPVPGLPPNNELVLPNGLRLQMTPDETQTYQQALGQFLRPLASSLSTALDSMPPQARQQVLAQIEAQARKSAEGQTIAHAAQSGQLTQRLQAALQQQPVTAAQHVLS